MKIAVTGSNGLIGSRFCTLLQNHFNILHINLSDGVNILDRDLLFERLASFSPLAIIHFAAKTHVDRCEEDKKKDVERIKKFGIIHGKNIQVQNIQSNQWEDKLTAFSVNVVGTKNLVDYASSNNVKMIYISTDFVFDGEKQYYTEEDNPSPINWYGQTKLWGEKIVSLNPQSLIVRIAYPYGKTASPKKDFVAKLIELLSTRDDLTLVSDHYVTPTFIDDIVYGLKFLIAKKESGIYHLVGDSFVSPYEAGLHIAKIFSYDRIHIGKIQRKDFFRGKAKRPFKLRLRNDKLENLGFKTKTFEEGLREIKTQITNS